MRIDRPLAMLVFPVVSNNVYSEPKEFIHGLVVSNTWEVWNLNDWQNLSTMSVVMFDEVYIIFGEGKPAWFPGNTEITIHCYCFCVCLHKIQNRKLQRILQLKDYPLPFKMLFRFWAEVPLVVVWFVVYVSQHSKLRNLWCNICSHFNFQVIFLFLAYFYSSENPLVPKFVSKVQV